MARLVIHDLTTNYPRIDQTIANLPNAFFGAFNQAQDQQLKRELADLSKQKTQMELASLGQNMQSQAAADQAWQSMMSGGATSAQPLSLGDLGGGYLSTLRSRESGGNDAARNPNSTATGRYQFTAGTWSDLARKYPQLGLTPDGRTDPAQQERAIQAFTEDNRKALQAAGIAPSDANLYTAHFLGAGGARNFLSALQQDPTVLAADVVDPRAVAANRTMFFDGDRPLTVAEAASRIQRGFTGAAPRTQVAQADIPMAGASPVQGFAVPEASQPFTILPNLSTEQLVQLRGLRGLDDQRRGLIDMALKERLDRQNADKPTDDIREYQFYVRQATAAGQQPADFTTWMRDNKKAGAMTVDMTGEREESKAFGKAVGESAAETMKAAGSASKQISQLNNLQQRLEQVAQGRLAPGKMKLTAFAKSLGLNDEFLEGIGLDPQKLGDAQAIQAITGRMVVDMIGSGGFPANNFSDADREFLLSTVPSLANDPRANKLIIETAKRAAQMNIDKARAWRDWKRGNKDGSFFDFETDWIARMQQQDVFGDLRREAEALGGAGAQQAGGDGGQGRPVPVRTEEDFRLLPSGTLFTAPDGTVRRKP